MILECWRIITVNASIVLLSKPKPITYCTSERFKSHRNTPSRPRNEFIMKHPTNSDLIDFYGKLFLLSPLASPNICSVFFMSLKYSKAFYRSHSFNDPASSPLHDSFYFIPLVGNVPPQWCQLHHIIGGASIECRCAINNKTANEWHKKAHAKNNWNCFVWPLPLAIKALLSHILIPVQNESVSRMPESNSPSSCPYTTFHFSSAFMSSTSVSCQATLAPLFASQFPPTLKTSARLKQIGLESQP